MLAIMLFLYQGGVKWFVENNSSPLPPGKQELDPVPVAFLSIIQEQFYYQTPHPNPSRVFPSGLSACLISAGPLDISGFLKN